jgi:hypothetical protein
VRQPVKISNGCSPPENFAAIGAGHHGVYCIVELVPDGMTIFESRITAQGNAASGDMRAGVIIICSRRVLETTLDAGIVVARIEITGKSRIVTQDGIGD